MLIHILDIETEEALCAATLLDYKTTPQADWNWTDVREEADCPECTAKYDEAAWEAAQDDPWAAAQAEAERAAYLDELALDDAVNESRGIYA